MLRRLQLQLVQLVLTPAVVAWSAVAAPRAPTATANAFQRDGIAFVQGFLEPSIFERVAGDARKVRGNLRRAKQNLAEGRLGCVLDSRSGAYQLLQSEATCERLVRCTGQPLQPADFPIELRHYCTGGEMGWHRDDVLFEPAQCEVVLTLENTSDSETEWIDAAGEVHSCWTPPNSAIIVRAGDAGARHRVRMLRRGERTILKLVFASAGAERSDEFWTHVDRFHGLRSRGRPGARSGRRPRDAPRSRR